MNESISSSTQLDKAYPADTSGLEARGASGSRSGLTSHADRFAVPSHARRRVPPKLYRIGEVVDYSGVSRQTIHNYTTMGLLRENRWTPGGHRLYDEDVFGRLDQIAELKARNMAREEIRGHFARFDDERGGQVVVKRPG